MTDFNIRKGHLGALAILLVSNGVFAQQAGNFGADIALSIRDCSGIAALDSCVWPGDAPHFQNYSLFSKFTSVAETTTINLSQQGYGGGTAGVEFSGALYTPTLRNTIASEPDTRNGASIFARQVVTFTGTAPTEVPFGGEFSYTASGTVDGSCNLFKDIDTGGFQFLSSYTKDQCGGINVQLQITDLDLDQVVASESLQSTSLIISPTTVQTSVEMVPGRPYEIYAVVQTIVRGAGQMIDSSNSFEIGLVDPDTGTVTKDIPESLPELQNTLVPASDDIQPEGIEIDVLPGSADNEIRVGRRGVIPVALITTPSFYALDVDRDSLQFGPGASPVAHSGGGPVDIDGDGDLDFVVHFSAEDAAFGCSDATAYLSGQTVGNDIVIGSDPINVTGCP